MEEKKTYKKMTLSFDKLAWIFFVCCVAGFIVETLWCLIKHGYIESRQSLVYGPFSIAYGMGGVLLTLVLYKFQEAEWWKIFLVAFVSGTVTEYICSLGQEICFGSVAWDYSHLPLNINGRVCLLYSIFWGVLGLGWVKFIFPLVQFGFEKLNIPVMHIVLWVLIVFFVFDAILSAAAAARMNARQSGAVASNSIERILDDRFPDSRMDKIYANSRNVEEIDR